MADACIVIIFLDKKEPAFQFIAMFFLKNDYRTIHISKRLALPPLLSSAWRIYPLGGPRHVKKPEQ
jgi:hypothetical protein